MIGFLEHHGVAVTVEHLHAFGLPGAREAVAEVYGSFTACTTTSGDFNHTVRTAGTPDGSSGGIFQDFDALDVFGCNLEECGELFFVLHVFQVEVIAAVVFEDVSVDHNQRFLATVDGSHTTKAHAGTGTKVTGVGDDVQTCDLSLKSIGSSFKGETFHLVHVKRLLSGGDFSFRNDETVGSCLSRHRHLCVLKGILVNQLDIEASLSANGDNLGLITNIRNSQFIGRVLDNH